MQNPSGTGTVPRTFDPRGAATLARDRPQAIDASDGDPISGRGITDSNIKKA